MTVWELATQGLSLAGTVWDCPFLFSLSQSLPQIPLSEVHVTTSQTIDLPWDQPNNYRGHVDSVCLLGKLNFGWAAPHSLTRVPYGGWLSTARPLPVATGFRNFFSWRGSKAPLVPDVFWRLGLSLTGNWERCLRTGGKLTVAGFWAFLYLFLMKS